MARVCRARSWPGKPTPSQERKKIKKEIRKAVKEAAHSGPPPDLLPFQREGVDFLAENNWRVLLADAPGCGKTAQALTAIAENAAKLCPVLVVVPSSVLRNWKIEATRWVPGIRVQTVDAMGTPLVRGHHLTLITWDMMVRRAVELQEYGFRLLVCDEAHYAKNPDSLRGSTLATLCGCIPHLLIMTGTPVLNDLSELETLESLFGEERPPMLRRLLEDVATQIPPKKRVYLQAHIPDDIRAEYEEVTKKFGPWLNSYLAQVATLDADDGDTSEEDAGRVRRALTAEPLAKLGYLRRILGRGKVPATAAWVRYMVTRKEPVVVFGHFADVMDLLGQALAKLEITYVRLDGTTNAEMRQAAVEAFQRGDVDVFLGTSAAREGLTLTRAAHLLRMERDYVPAYEEQAEDRIRRIGQTRPTTMWYMHAADTIDARITDIVDQKRALVAQTIGSADIPLELYPEVLSAWQRIEALREGVPRVADNPRASIQLPRMPPVEQVHAVVLQPAQWPIDALQRALRQAGYRSRALQRLPGNRIRLICRSLSAFLPNSLHGVEVAPGLTLVIGAPVGSRAERMRSMRQAQKREVLRVPKRVVVWGGSEKT